MIYTIVIFCIFAFMARNVFSVFQGFEHAAREASKLQLGGMTQSRRRCSAMHCALDVVWGPWDPESDETLEFDRPTLHSISGYRRSYFGPLDMEVDGDQVVIYDLELGIDLHTQNPDLLFQTVVSIKPPGLELPAFVIRPRSIYSRHSKSPYIVRTNTALEMQFDVESLTTHRVKALLTSELGTEVLIPFLAARNWTVEWTGDWLIVYEVDRLIDPSRLAEVALEVSEFFDLLKSGPEAVDQEMKKFFHQACKN